MNALNNTVQLIGNLGKNVAITSFESGSKKATTTLAITTYYKNGQGETMKNTQWHAIVAWGKNAEQMAKVLVKGNRIAIMGSLTNRSYEDKKNQTRFITEILVDEFMKITNPAKEIKAPLPAIAE